MVKTKQENREYGAKPGAKHLIGTLGERSLHSALKEWYALPGDQEEEVRCNDGTGSWRRKGLRIMDRYLIEILSKHIFKKPSDFKTLIPFELPEPYSTKELAEGIDQPRWLAQKMAYCLRHMGLIDVVGKNGNSFLYTLSTR
jgi:hypothetical protein